MVGKPTLPVDANTSTELKGAAMTSAGLSALDQEREASMADEGGASGAIVEMQDALSIGSERVGPWSAQYKTSLVLASIAAGALAGVFFARSKLNKARRSSPHADEMSA